MTLTAARYEELRRLHDSLTRRLHQSLSQRALEESGRRLALRRTGELERALVLESAVYDQVVGGKTAVERMAARPDLTADERLLLSAMRDARVTVFEVLERASPFGVQARDVLSGDTFFFADARLSEAGEPGDMGMLRLMRLPEFAMSTGLPLEVPRFALQLIARAGVLPPSAFTPKSRAQIAASLYRLALAQEEEELKAQLASMALQGTDPLSLALGRALKAPR